MMRRLHWTEWLTAAAAWTACWAAPTSAGAAALRLRVADERGHAIAGARASVWALRDGEFERLAHALTDASGKATLDAELLPPLRLSVAAPGKRRFERDLTAGDGGELFVRLEAGGSLTVFARDAATGQPITEFTLLALPVGAAESAPGRADYVLEGVDALPAHDREGRGLLTGLPEAPVTVVVQAPGYPPGVVPRARAGGAPASVELDRSGCSEHRVVDAEAGAPVVGARAALDPTMLGAAHARFTLLPESDGIGRLTLCAAPASSGRWLIAHPDYAPAMISGAAALAASASPMRLSRGGVIEGVIEDADQAPVVGALVQTTTLGLLRQARSGTDGRYRLDALAPGALTIDLLAAGGQRVAARREAVVREAQVTTVDFRTEPFVRLQLLENDQPRASVEVTVLTREAEGPPQPGPSHTADQDGWVALPRGAEPAPLLAVHERGGFVFAPLPAPRTGDASPAFRQLSLTGRRVRGLVAAAADGAPLRGARISCSRGAALRTTGQRGPLWLAALGAQVVCDGPASVAASDDRGQFEVFAPDWCTDLLVVGPTLAADAPPFEPQRVPLLGRRWDQPVRVALERGRTIVAAVASASGAVGAEIEISLHRPGQLAAVGSVSSVGEAARLTPPDGGPWLVVARAAGWAPAIAGPLHLAPGVVESVELRFERGGLIVVQLGPDRAEGPGGSAAGRPSVTVVDVLGRDWTPFVHSAGAAATNQVVVGPLPGGRYVVAAGARDELVTLTGDGQTATADLRD